MKKTETTLLYIILVNKVHIMKVMNVKKNNTVINKRKQNIITRQRLAINNKKK